MRDPKKLSQVANEAAIREMIAEGRKASMAASAATEQAAAGARPATTEQTAAGARPTTATEQAASAAKPATEPRDQLSVIPYAIINCITQLDNIYETRLFGWVLAKAQSVLKLYNKDLSEINVQHALDLTRVTLPARLLLNPDDKNYANVTKAFGLATKKITYERDNREYHLNIIAFPEVIKDGRRSSVTFVIHSEIWHALLDFSRGHRTFSLPAYIRLTSKYSVILYLLVSQQTHPVNYSFSRLKQLLGCADYSSYNRGANFVTKVLDPAREELLAKAPYFFDYSCTKSGSSHAITEIIIIPQPNPKQAVYDELAKEEVMRLRLRLDDDVRRYCEENFYIKPQPLGRIEPLIVRIGEKNKQLGKLAEIKEQCILRRVQNPAGYLTKSIQNLYREGT